MRTALLFRRIHLWLGCLFAPLLIFFAVTGAIQTLGLTPLLSKKGGSDELPALSRIVLQMSAGHLARRQPFTEVSGRSEYRPFSWNPSDARFLPYSGFAALMALGLVVTSGLGIWMAYRFGGSAKAISLVLLLGVLLPFFLYKWRFPA